jgi:hypothetical protein
MPNLLWDHHPLQRRLADEALGEDGGAAWGAFGGGEDDEQGWRGDQYETAEEYAQRIWEEMQASLAACLCGSCMSASV